MPTKLVIFFILLVLAQIAVSIIYSSNIIVESDQYNKNKLVLDNLKLDVQELENKYSNLTSLAALASASATLKPITKTIDLSQ